VAAFLNPVLPEVREFALSFIREIVSKYDFDVYALDYCRFPDNQSDFSEASKRAFEDYVKGSVATWPDDVYTYDANGGIVAGPYYKQWWEFRSMVIRDFVAAVRQEIKALKPDVKLEYWAASWWGALYANGQNWASTSFMPLQDIEAPNFRAWCSNNYNRTGFADQLDTFLLGTYLPRVYGPEDGESIEFGINRAERMLLNACTYYGTIECSQKNFDVEEACYYCLKRTAGLMVFDIVHRHQQRHVGGHQAGHRPRRGGGRRRTAMNSQTTMRTMKRLFLIAAALTAATTTSAREYTVTSPDGKIEVKVSTQPELRWSLSRAGERLSNRATSASRWPARRRWVSPPRCGASAPKPSTRVRRPRSRRSSASCTTAATNC